MSADLRLGRWQDVLTDVECDACIFDAPYGERVHEKHNAGTLRRNDNSAASVIDYAPMTPSDVREFVGHWSPRTRGWLCSLTSHDLIPHWESTLERVGRYVFPPLPVLDQGMSARRAGDGPASWTVFMVVSRPRSVGFSRWGALPGCYVRSAGDERSERMGGKPLGVMRAIVRDYSRPGDLVCDPFAGGGTTLLAALMEGRRAVGSERDPEAHAAASARLGRGYTLDMFAGVGS